MMGKFKLSLEVQCDCPYEGRLAPEHHAVNCAWRNLAEYERELDHDARREMQDD